MLHNYGPEAWNGSIHIEIPDTYSADRLDALIRDIEETVYRKHNVILTAVGVYSMNTKDQFITETRKKVQSIVLAHEFVKGMHGFYLDRENKHMRFDAVISFDAKDRETVYQQIVADVQAAFPEYELRIAMDLDLS